MKSLERIKGSIIAIILACFIILFTTDMLMLNKHLKEAALDISKEHVENTMANLEGEFEGLSVTTSKIANNEKVKQLLLENKKYEDFSESDITTMKNVINDFEGVLKTATFVSTINIASSYGEYLFAKGSLYENFTIRSRPWYAYRDINIIKTETAFTTSVHKDYISDEYTLSIVSPIYNEDRTKVSGAVILDVLIKDLIKSIEKNFFMGDVDVFVDTGDGYYGMGGIVTEDEIKTEDGCYSVVKSQKEYLKNVKMLFKYDETSLIFTKDASKFRSYELMFYLVFGIILSLMLIIFVIRLFKPITTCIERFTHLLADTDYSVKNINGDEIQKLEEISKALKISLDKRIENLIYYDDLTKLPNRKELYKIANGLINENKEFAIIFIDLNKFKSINDLYGHTVGDEVLKNFGGKLKNILGEKGVVSRYSGDEYILIYKDYTSSEELSNYFSKEVYPMFSTPLQVDGNNIKVNFSAGVAIYPKDGQDLDKLIKHSDFIMYKSKGIKKQELLFFNEDTYYNLINIEQLKRELKFSVENNELLLNYQPIVNEMGETLRVEALVRWKNKRVGFIPPLEFIKYAEETGDIIKLGYWVIEEVCRNYSLISSRSKNQIQININVSPIQLMKDDFVQSVEGILKCYNIETNRICFEITESVFIKENPIILNNLEELYIRGIKIALDDFGTGYSSFSYLKRFKLNTLKIDKMFIQSESSKDYCIIESIKNIANVLDIDVVIEGVETEEQFNSLKNINCGLFQGYLFSKPLTLMDLLQYLK